MAMGNKDLLMAIDALCKEHIDRCNAEIKDKENEWSCIDSPLALLDYDVFITEKENDKRLPESILTMVHSRLQAVS